MPFEYEKPDAELALLRNLSECSSEDSILFGQATLPLVHRTSPDAANTSPPRLLVKTGDPQQGSARLESQNAIRRLSRDLTLEKQI